MFQRRRTALALAAVLSIGASGTAAAADTADITETLNVQSTLAIVLDTAAFTYNVMPGGISSLGTTTVQVTGNAAFAVNVAGSDFTGPAGTIPGTVREIKLALASGGTMAPGTDAWHVADTINPIFAGPQPNATPASFQLQSRVNLTALPNATAGTYSGTLTISVEPA